MAGRGFAPKDGTPEIVVDGDGVVRGPELPELETAWPAPTLTWWNNWRTSAQAQLFKPTDWDVLAETALLHAKFWEGDHSVAGELRLRVAKFGATLEDRARLKMEVGTPKAKASPKAKAKR